MASLAFDVLGVETHTRKVDQLNAGQLPIYEPGLRELLCSGLVRQPHFASWPGRSPVLGVRAGGASVLVPGGGGSRRPSG
jgi:UDP-glucose/GDP-mannose dehydrogenase family protein